MTVWTPRRARAVFLVGPERLELREVEVAPPGAGELLVAVEAATTCGTDIKVFHRGGHPRMLSVPGPFGHEVAGRVVACGAGPLPFREGDPVVVANSASCGACPACRAGRENLCADLVYLNGAYADFLLVPERFVQRSTYLRPAQLAASAAALSEPLACVEHGIERLPPAPPGAALVLGAGPIGLMLVALLAEAGHEVTAADPHPARLETARRLGATETLFVRRGGGQRPDEPLPRRFDLTVESTGTVDGWSAAVAAARPGASVLFFGGCPPGDVLPLPTYPVHYDELALLGAYHHTPRSFARALERLASGRLNAQLLISREAPLHEVERALRDMMGRRTLKTAIRPELG